MTLDEAELDGYYDAIEAAAIKTSERRMAEQEIKRVAALVLINGGGWAQHSAAVETLIMANPGMSLELVEILYDTAVAELLELGWLPSCQCRYCLRGSSLEWARRLKDQGKK